MKEVLVLGGGGFIGRNIVEYLVKRGDCNITAADIKEGSNWREISNDESTRDRFKAVLADFTDICAFDNLNQSFDEVYMMAAVVGVNRTLKFPKDVIRINTLLTMNTLDWISRNPIKRLLFASSSENYAGTSDLFNTEIPTAEDVPLCVGDVKHPRWTYAMTKMHGESAFIQLRHIITNVLLFGTRISLAQRWVLVMQSHILLSASLRANRVDSKSMGMIKHERFVI